MTKRALTDHRHYIEAVGSALEAQGIETGGVTGGISRGSRRTAAIGLGREAIWDYDDSHTTLSLSLEWDEERGWMVHDVHEPGATRGTAHGRYDLDLGLVPEPEEIVLRVRHMLRTGDPGRYDPVGRAHRSAAEHDPEFEAALAAYLPA
ncbi:DUF6292 family protein [Actinomadura kijaniata]|uniref:DUF6292 family protein n=1 Tax=Actinomadura kijaniata TaxID=46161 RepID=UPI000836D76A|nr:DUF6292 family protein [Actinomadura kijaniata]